MGMPIDANWTQEDYAFYEDGTESGSTLIGSAGAQQTLEVDTTYFCRLAISDTTGANATGEVDLRCIWQYNLAGGGWTDVGTTTPVQFAASANVTDGGTTSNRQPTGTGTFNAGRIYESAANTTIVYTAPGDETTSHTEVLLVFTIDSAQVTDGQEILIRCINNVGGVTPTVYPGTYTNADIDVNETVPTAITGSASIVFTDPATDLTPALTPSFAGSADIAFTDPATDITPSPGNLQGSTSVTFADPATTIEDINVGSDPITGSGAITFSDTADITPSIGDIAGSTSISVTTAGRFNLPVSGVGIVVGPGNIRYGFARNLTRYGPAASLTLGAMTGSAAIVFSDPATTIEDANPGFDEITGSGAIVFGDLADITPSIGDLVGSSAWAFTDTADLTPSLGDLTGSGAVTFGDAADLTPSVGDLTGTSTWAFTDVADITPSVGVLAGSTSIVTSDAATTISDANAASVPSKLQGLGRKLRYRFDNRLGFSPSVLTANVARFYGIQRLVAATVVRYGSVADLTPAIGRLEGSTSIVTSDVSVIEDANAGVASLAGSTTITFADPATEITSFQFDGSTAITFGGTADITPSRGRLRGTSSDSFTLSGSIFDAGKPPAHGVGTVLGQPFRQWGTPVAIVLSTPPTSTTAQGEIAGSATITFGQASDLSAPAALAASANITFGDQTTLDNVGGPGTVAITGSTSITFGDSATLIAVDPIAGTAIIRFLPSASVKGNSRLVGTEEIQFSTTGVIRADASIEGSTLIQSSLRATYLDNIGVNLITGSTSIIFSDSVRGDITNVSWQKESGESGSWTKETEETDGWTKETADSGNWMKEAV